MTTLFAIIPLALIVLYLFYKGWQGGRAVMQARALRKSNERIAKAVAARRSVRSGDPAELWDDDGFRRD